MTQTNAQKFVARGLAMKQRESIYIPERTEDEFAFMDRPVPSRRQYGKSSSNPGRICLGVPWCREFIADKDAICPHCGSTP